MSSTTLDLFKRPATDADYAAPSKIKPAGLGLGLVGLMVVAVALVANVVAAGDGDIQILAWSFGLTTVGVATIKLGIAAILIAIVLRLWMRVDAVKAALPVLKADAADTTATKPGEIDTAFGPATVSASAPKPLGVHRLARLMWAPMLAMGAMAVIAGFVLSLVQAGTDSASDFVTLGAWVQGIQFLGEGLILAGISFLLGTILGALRTGGGEVQESVGAAVKTLRMPWSAKLFLALMMTGVMLAIAQFVLYLVAAYGDVDQAVWFAWLAPLREVALGILLSGIVLALYTIGTVLGFQFSRIRELIETGR
jgi:hypothetical protein